MLKGKTKSGFEYEVADETLNNFELIEVLSEVDSNPLLVPKLVKMLLGEEQKNKLSNHVRNEKGIVPVDSISNEIMEIFQGDKLKNSFRYKISLGSSQVSFYTYKEYAQRHNEGLDGMPKRQFMGKSNYLGSQIYKKIEKKLNELLKK